MPGGGPGKIVMVRSTKYDGSPHYEFEARLLAINGSRLTLSVIEGTPLHGYRGELTIVTDFTALFWTDRWYNVYHNHRPAGRRGILSYANVATPAQYDGSIVRWVDLDLDVLTVAGRVVVDDEDEFAEHGQRFSYPAEIVEHAVAAKDELVRLAEAGQYPFDRASHLPDGAS